MLQIKRETDYAIRCVHYLVGKQGEATMVDEIAREMCIPKTFLAKILQKLTKAGLVTSRKGVKGGFELSQRPEEISFYDVVVAIEGPVAMNICTVSNNACGLRGRCRVHPFWVTIRAEVERLLRGVSFKKTSPYNSQTGGAGWAVRRGQDEGMVP